MLRRILLSLFLVAAMGGVSVSETHWPEWRGSHRNGVSDELNPPLRWSSTENIHWKLPLPGRSGSTPVLWEDRLFLVVTERERMDLWAVDRKTGRTLWKRPLGSDNRTQRKANMSSPSPVTDGQSVWVLTSSGLLRRFDFEGREVWLRNISRDHGVWGLQWGYGSSPVLHEDALYIQVLHGSFTDGPSYVLRIDKVTGRTVWRVERPTDAVRESPDSYATPALVKTATGLELVVSGGDCVTGHDLQTGRELWRLNGMNPSRRSDNRVVASPVAHEDLLFVPGRERPLVAIRAGGRGNVTTTHRVWSTDFGPDVPSPVTDGTYLYVLRDNGTLYAFDVKTGAPAYTGQRLAPGTYSASLSLAGGKLFATNEDGTTTIVKAGPRFEVLGQNHLEDYTLSSAIFARGQLFIRTDSTLWAIGKPES